MGPAGPAAVRRSSKRRNRVYAAPHPAYAAPAPAADAMDNKLEQLQSLADLKAQGVLTDAEFEAQKAKILAG